MESKKKTFTRKVVAFFLAVVMALSAFSGAFSAFAANEYRNYNDDKLASNILAWADATDEQTLEAVLDYIDTVLAGANINLDVEQNIVIKKISIHAKLRSIDDVIELLGVQIPNTLKGISGLAGDVASLNLSNIQNIQGQADSSIACGMNYRDSNSAKILIKHFVMFLNDNANSTSSIFYKLLDGTFTLGGAVEGILKGTVYDKLIPMLGVKSGYQSDFFYNITKSMMLSKTGWFTPEEAKKYEDGTLPWNIDTVTRNKVNEMWLPQISAWVTYTIYNHDPKAEDKPHTESSAERLDKIQAEMTNKNCNYETACTNLGYDPNLKYCTIDTLENNINIFAYGNETLAINADTTLYSFAAQAFKLAWKTVLKDTLQLVHVNHDNWKQDGSPTNFDNEFFYYLRDNNKWNKDNWKSNYSQANVEAWAEASYKSYGLASAQEFIDLAKAEYANLSRTLIENPTYTWKDLEIMQFFNKLRYSPLADIYFDIQTGPLNLYLLQTGTPNTNAFLDAWSNTPNGIDQPGILDEFNNGLVAMCKDLFVEGKNIGLANGDGTVTAVPLPTFVETNTKFTRNSADHNDKAKMEIVDAVTTNFFYLIEYLLQTSDVNVLANLYKTTGVPFTGTNYQLNESNLEKSMLPLLIAAVNEVQIGGQRLMDQIHDETWDKCTSVEAVAVFVLEEHLAWILPDKDYQGLYSFNDQGDMIATQIFNTPETDSSDKNAEANLLEDVILVMARDAVGYQLAPILPLRHKVSAGNYQVWSPYSSDVMQDKTTLYDLLNAVIVFYCGTNKWSDDNTESQGMAALLGIIEGSGNIPGKKANGNCAITVDNDLFQNCDNIVNHLLPFFGILQNGDMASAGKFETRELLIDVLVDGALDIATKKDTANIFEGTAAKDYSGLKVFLYQLLTIISCDPIINMDVEHVLYDVVLVPILNNVFGARFDDVYPHAIPTSDEMNKIMGAGAGDTPIDSLFHKQVLVHYNGKAGAAAGQGGIGILGMLFDAVTKALGASNYANNDGKNCIEGTWNAAAFICQSVANLEPYFAPQLKAHKFGVLTTKVGKANQTGVASGKPLQATNLELKNNSIGLNRFHVVDENGKRAQESRYYMNVKSVAAFNNNTNAPATNITFGNSKIQVAPQQTATISITGKGQSNTDVIVYRIDTTYDVVVKEGGTEKVTFPDQTSTTYLVVSPDKDWFHETYEHEGGDSFVAGGIAPNQTNNAGTNSTSMTGTANGGVFATFPDTVIVNTSNPGAVSKGQVRYENKKYADDLLTKCRVRGLYFKPTDKNLEASFIPKGSGNRVPAKKGVAPAAPEKVLAGFPGHGGNINELGYATIDQSTGAILRLGMFDYYHPIEGRWYRGGADGRELHAGGGKDCDGAFIGYTDAQINEAGQKTVNYNGKQVKLQDVPGYEIRTHVVWEYEEYMGSCDYNNQNNDDTVKYVSRTKVGVDAKGNDVFKYNFVLIRINDAILFGDNGSCTMATPVPGINLTMGHQDFTRKGQLRYMKWLAWDGKTQLEQASITADVVLSAEGNSAGIVPVKFQVVDDSALNELGKEYESTSQFFAPYKEADFNYVDFKGNSVNPYNKLQETLGIALRDSSRVINRKSADSFKSNKTEVAAVTSTRSQIGALAYTRVSVAAKDPIAPEVAVNAIIKGDNYFYDKACTIPVLTATKLTDGDVTGITTETVDKQQLQVGTTAYGEAVVKDANGNWHFRNAPKYETIWDVDTYSAPYLKKTSTQVGLKDNAPVYEQVVYRTYSVKEGNEQVPTNNIANINTIITPNEGVTENRNETEKTVDTLKYWKEQAMGAISGGGANDIVTQVRDDFKAKYDAEYINYNVQTFNNLKQTVDEAMSLVTTTWVNSERPLMDPINKDQQMKDPVTGELLWEKDPVYSTKASTLQVLNAIEQYNNAVKNLIKKDYTANKVLEEIAWSLDDAKYADGTGLEALTFTKTTNEAGSTVYTEVKAPTAYYGTSENGVLVNKTADGAQAYTDASWANYINRLGRAIDAAQTYTVQNNTRSEAFFARNDLMLAENELDPFVPTEPQPGNDITVSGKALISKDTTGTASSGGIIGIDVVANGEVVATSAADGSFTATVPAGTTELVFKSKTAFERTVTIAGNTDVSDINVPIVICDYSPDAVVDATDDGVFYECYNGEYNVYMDLSPDGVIDATDNGLFMTFYGQTINYTPLSF